MPLRRVDPRADRGSVYRVHGRLVASAPMRRLALTRPWGLVVWNVDRLLLRATGGRVSTASPVRTAVLETRGARTGQQQRSAVIYFHDGDAVVVVASNGGRPRHPAWFHNARADPDVVLGGEPFRATLADDAERLWPAADRIFPAYAKYREAAAHADRTIPILRLTPRAGEQATGPRATS